MEKIDARKLPLSALKEKRRQAVRLRRKGLTRAEIGEIVGVHTDTVGRWLKSYRDHGAQSLKPNRRGRHEGSGRRLDNEQEWDIRQVLLDKMPDQLKMPYTLWTRKSVGMLIKERFGVDLPIRTVGHYLKRWGMTPQKPAKRSYVQQPVRLQKWLDDEYPQIHDKASVEGAEIYWGDETGLHNDYQPERGYAPRGQTPVVRLNAKRHSVNMISAITNQGKVRFRLFQGGMNTDILIGFMRRLIKDAKSKVILILDNLRVHHAKKVKNWLFGKEEQIEVFYLPSYSPELNPDEYPNCNFKASAFSGQPAHSGEHLKKKRRSL